RAFLVLGDRILGGVDDGPEAVLPSLGRGVGVLGKGGQGGRRSEQPDDGRSEGARSHGGCFPAYVAAVKDNPGAPASSQRTSPDSRKEVTAPDLRPAPCAGRAR